MVCWRCGRAEMLDGVSSVKDIIQDSLKSLRRREIILTLTCLLTIMYIVDPGDECQHEFGFLKPVDQKVCTSQEQSAMRERHISPQLRCRLKEHRIELSEKSRIRTLGKNRWVITDEKDRMFALERKGDKLHTNTLPSRTIDIAIIGLKVDLVNAIAIFPLILASIYILYVYTTSTHVDLVRFHLKERGGAMSRLLLYFFSALFFFVPSPIHTRRWVESVFLQSGSVGEDLRLKEYIKKAFKQVMKVLVGILNWVISLMKKEAQRDFAPVRKVLFGMPKWMSFSVSMVVGIVFTAMPFLTNYLVIKLNNGWICDYLFTQPWSAAVKVGNIFCLCAMGVFLSMTVLRSLSKIPAFHKSMGESAVMAVRRFVQCLPEVSDERIACILACDKVLVSNERKSKEKIIRDFLDWLHQQGQEMNDKKIAELLMCDEKLVSKVRTNFQKQ
jgi:hypothetical protein